MKVADMLFGRLPPPPPVGVGRVNKSDVCKKKVVPSIRAGAALEASARSAALAKQTRHEPSQERKVPPKTIRARERREKVFAAIKAGLDSTTRISSRTGIAAATVLQYTDELSEKGLIEIERRPPGLKVRRYKMKGSP